jgi:hypothetical protein
VNQRINIPKTIGIRASVAEVYLYMGIRGETNFPMRGDLDLLRNIFAAEKNKIPSIVVTKPTVTHGDVWSVGCNPDPSSMMVIFPIHFITTF